MKQQETKESGPLDVFSLLSSPSYSPSTLRHLPHPVPNDLPPELDAHIFTFEDAFEDLLAVSQGRALPSIYTRYHQRYLLRDMFPTGEPTWFWLRRLQSQGLIQVSPYTRLIRAHHPHWTILHEELDRDDAETLRSISTGTDMDDHVSRNLFGSLGRAFKQLERGLIGEHADYSKGAHSKTANGENEPNNFEEMFSAIASEFKESSSAWDTFVKAITEEAKAPSRTCDGDHMQYDKHGNNEVVTTENEYVDRFGYLHKTVTRKTLDSDGNETGCETHITIRPADKHLNNEIEEQGKLHLPGKDEPETKGLSWFWK